MNTSIIKTLILGIAVALLNLNAYSQDMVFGRADFIHGNGFDKVTDIHIDSNDNLYVTGIFEKGGNIGNISVKSAGENTLFIAKYNKEGFIQYTKQFGGDGRISVHSITSDSEGNLYLTGTFRKTCIIAEETLTSSDFQDNFLIKVGSKGEFLWVKQIQADTKEEKQLLLCDKDDNVILGGSFYKSLTIENEQVKSSSNSDIYIAVFDKLGNLKNLVNIEGQQKDMLKDMIITDDNRLFITGSFTESINLSGELLKSKGRQDVFWAELNLNKEAIKLVNQAKQLGGRFDDKASKIIIQDEIIYLSGSFQDELEYRKGNLISKGVTDVFLCRYKLNGRELGAISIGGAGNDYPHSMLMNDKGELYIIGNFRGSIEAEDKQIITKEHQSDNFVMKSDKEGNIMMLFSFGGDDNDFPVEAAMTKDNIIYLTGTYRSDFIFGDKKSRIKSKNNIFLTELYDCENAVLDLGSDLEVCGESYVLSPDIDCMSYQWNNGSINEEIIINSSGNYELQVKDVNGCPASDNINIILHPLPEIDLGEDMIIEKGNIINITAEAGFKSYQWTSSDIPETFETNGETLNINTEELLVGAYSFNLLATDENGCTCEDQIMLTVGANPSEPSINTFSAEIIPNPNDGRFTLYINNADTKSKIIYEIYSPDGKLIIKKTANSLKEEINLQTKAEGSYILKIINGNSVLNKTIIVTK